jgi:hypothetical protein
MLRLHVLLALPFAILTLVACESEGGGGSGGPGGAKDTQAGQDLATVSDTTVPPDTADATDIGSQDLPGVPCICGDGVCEPARCGESWVEGARTCAADCAVCGDGTCDPGEGVSGPGACLVDCCGSCGDGLCRGGECGEDPAACPQDCGFACGNTLCEPGETPVGCPEDCEPFACGNGTCEPTEAPGDCPEDCGLACGDCACEGGETYETCPVDCGYCGDGYCITSCPYLMKEDGASCPIDCGGCVPDCSGMECGDDGCGGSCGPCDGDCVGGVCYPGGEDVVWPQDMVDVQDVGIDLGPPPPVGELGFVDAFGDDAQSCVAISSCVKHVLYNSQRALPVRYTEDNQPIEGVPIKYEVIEDPEDVGQMVVSTAYTNAEGIAEASVKVLKNMEANFKVRVTVYGADDVEPIYFVIDAGAKVNTYLTVSFTYTGMQIFDGVTVYLYKSVSPSSADLSCADVDPTALSAADLTKGPAQLSQTVKFETLPGLETDGEQFYTICARGERNDGTPVTFGCDDENGAVSSSASNYVQLSLSDIPSSLAGSYDVQTEADLISSLPAAAQTTVNALLNLLEKPSASILLLMCAIDEASLEDLCGYVFNDPTSPSVYDLTMVGSIILDLMDAFLAGTVDEWTGYDIFGVGEDIRDVFKAIRLLATFELQADPGPDGIILAGTTHGSWHTVSFRWTHGLDCSPSDDDCGVANLNIQATGQSAPETQFPATVAHGGGQSTMAIGEHALSLKVGLLFNHIVQKYVIPSVFGDGSDGLPVIDSYEKLTKVILGGGKMCLAPGPTQPSCCEAFAENVNNQAGSVSVSLLQASCESLVVMGAAYYEGPLLGLDVGTDDNLTLSTPDGQPCTLYDYDQDMKIDAWGKKEPHSERCTWDASLDISGGASTIEATFYGVEHQ